MLLLAQVTQMLYLWKQTNIEYKAKSPAGFNFLVTYLKLWLLFYNLQWNAGQVYI